MRAIKIKPEMSGKKIERAIADIFPKLSTGALYKSLRKKDIKVNGVRVKEGHIVKAGDNIEVYIVDEILFGANKSKAKLFDIVYEDANIIIVNKFPGISVHSDKYENEETLIDQVQEYLNTNNSLKQTAYLCHRLDRNTGGLLIIAKNQESLDILLDLIKNREITKLYKCVVYGKPRENEAKLVHYLEKDEKQSLVYIKDRKTPKSSEIITKYKILEYNRDKNISYLEVELITGKTHQIRAHLAYIGHPIIGDGKYGTNQINKEFGITKQQLWAYKLIFNFNNGGILNYLKDKTFEVAPSFNNKL